MAGLANTVLFEFTKWDSTAVALLLTEALSSPFTQRLLILLQSHDDEGEQRLLALVSINPPSDPLQGPSAARTEICRLGQ